MGAYTNHKRVQDIQLIIDSKDVMVKQFVAGIWDQPQIFTGFSYSTSLKIDSAFTYEKNKIPAKTLLGSNHHDVNVTFTNPIQQGEKYVYELQLLLNRKDAIRNLGTLNILEWPKEDLSEIIFLRNAGQIFFSSALAQVFTNQKENMRSISPGKFAKSLISHAGKSSAIRIEWGLPSQYRLRFFYTISNVGQNVANNVELQTYIPPTTKFQKTDLINNAQYKIINDEDDNTLVEIILDSIPEMSKRTFFFDVIIVPIGNSSVILPQFGDWGEYHRLTNGNSKGNQMIQSSKYWPTSENAIRDLVKVLKKNSANASEFITLAFEFVNQRIKYEINERRDDALATLISRAGDCSEMSDLFVCILRGGGIPAKIVHGWTINLDDNSLGPHAWCEFFSPQAGGWRQCDPTWGFLTGVSCQHICRQREGIFTDQHTFSWRFKGDTQLKIEEHISFEVV